MIEPSLYAKAKASAPSLVGKIGTKSSFAIVALDAQRCEVTIPQFDMVTGITSTPLVVDGSLNEAQANLVSAQARLAQAQIDVANAQTLISDMTNILAPLQVIQQASL